VKKILIPLLMLAVGRAVAQAPTCTGGLGDPIVKITFGSGTGFGPALPAGVSNMQYVANQCPNDGQYTIAHTTQSCFGNTWWSVLQDHTGDPNGYFMLINASYQPSTFYVQNISGLCPGTTYQFAAWVVNMVSLPGLILPDISFTIEDASNDSVLGTYDTGNIPETYNAAWVQYGFFFTTPPGISSVVLRMNNNQVGGNGNDVGIDDITFRAAGPSIQSSVTGFAGDTLSLCQNDPRTLGFNTAIENCYPTAVYQWQRSVDSGGSWADIGGAQGTAYSRAATGTGTYEYRLTVAQQGNIGISACEVASAPIMVTVIPIPTPVVTIAANMDSSCAGMPVSFTAVPDSGGPSPVYQWMVNGVGVGSGGPTYSTDALSSSDVVSCVMTSDAVCVLTPVVASNNLSVTVTPIPVTGVAVGLSANDICHDSVVVFTATPSNGGGTPYFQWMVNGQDAGGHGAVFTDAGLNDGDVVSCVMTADLTCAPPVSGSPVTMVVYPLPVVSLTPDTVIAGGTSVLLNPLVGGTVVSYAWSPVKWLDDPDIANPLATPVGSTEYRLTVVSDHGCVASAKEDVGVYYRLAMPGAFTPNGDGRNDVFRVPPGVPVEVHLLSVYNREGLCVYSAGGSLAAWDGKVGGHLQPAGQYVWVLDYENPLTRENVMAKGTVILVR
jgi:gliding motility-associated-like protein